MWIPYVEIILYKTLKWFVLKSWTWQNGIFLVASTYG